VLFLDSLGKRAEIVIHDARPGEPTLRVVPRPRRRSNPDPAAHASS
jgi:hypothetical protein